MKRFIKKFIQLFLAIVVIAILTVITIGHRTYETAIEAEPLVVAVEKHQQMAHYISYEDLNPNFINAVVAVEDKRFFERKGVDWVAFGRAIYHNLFYDTRREGGSTISQQVAKNLYFVSKPRSITLKVAEIFVMLDLENTYSKEDILALYANMNYYGDGYWGIHQASMGYFNKENLNCSIAQCAMLAGIPNAPAVYQLSSGFSLAKNRQEHVLKCMLRNNMINEEQYKKAIEENVLEQ